MQMIEYFKEIPQSHQVRLLFLPLTLSFAWCGTLSIKRCLGKRLPKGQLTLGSFRHSPQEMMEIPGILTRERGELCRCQSWHPVGRGIRGALLCCWRWMTSKWRLFQTQKWSQASGKNCRIWGTGSLVPKPEQPEVKTSKCLTCAASQRQFSILQAVFQTSLHWKQKLIMSQKEPFWPPG